MATLPKQLNAQELVKGHYTLEVRFNLNQWRWRLWLALLLCKLATKIAWLELTLIVDEYTDDFTSS